MKKGLIIGLALAVCLSSVGLGANNPSAKVAIHVKGHNPKQNCTTLPAIASCADIQTTYPGFSFDAFPVFFDLIEYKAFEYGMNWPAWTYSAAWSGCEDLVIGGIKWPGDGITQTWFACQTGPLGLPGWAWLYADGPGEICVVPHPIGGQLVVLDCNQGIDEPVSNYCAGVYGAAGDDPCEPTVTRPTTWSAIKSIFQ